jgi:hypothetical protein
MDATEAARRQVPAEQWLDVRLEDFMDAPRETLARVLEFLGLEWTPEFEAGFRRHTFQASRGVAWKRDLGDEHVALLERIIARPLTAYRYELLHSSVH